MKCGPSPLVRRDLDHSPVLLPTRDRPGWSAALACFSASNPQFNIGNRHQHFRNHRGAKLQLKLAKDRLETSIGSQSIEVGIDPQEN